MDITYESANLCVVNLDYDQVWPSYEVENPSLRYHVSRPTRNEAPYNFDTGKVRGLPAVARFLDDRTVPMTKPLAEWLYGIEIGLAGMTWESGKGDWLNILHDGLWVANFSGSDSRYDPITGNNSGREPIEAQPQACGGWILHIIGEGRAVGEDCWKVEAIDPLGNFRQYHPSKHWWLFGAPSNSYRVPIMNETGRQWTGEFLENGSEPFPMFNVKSTWPVFGYGGYNLIQKWRVRVLGDNEQIPSPFVRV